MIVIYQELVEGEGVLSSEFADPEDLRPVIEKGDKVMILPRDERTADYDGGYYSGMEQYAYRIVTVREFVGAFRLRFREMGNSWSPQWVVPVKNMDEETVKDSIQGVIVEIAAFLGTEGELDTPSIKIVGNNNNYLKFNYKDSTGVRGVKKMEEDVATKLGDENPRTSFKLAGLGQVDTGYSAENTQMQPAFQAFWRWLLHRLRTEAEMTQKNGKPMRKDNAERQRCVNTIGDMTV